jgi:hypothetical protein
MSGAIPEKLMVKQAMLSDSNMVRKTVELYAASANSQTNYSSGDRLLFSIPAYAHSFIDFSKSYMKFVGKTTNSANVALGKALFYDGIPCFDRLQIRANGTVLEDIQQYQNLERIMMLSGKSKGDIEGDLVSGHYTVGRPAHSTDELIARQQEKGVGFVKKLHSGIFSLSDYLFPVFRTTGMELELDIGSRESVIRGGMASSNGNASSNFMLTDVKFVFSLLTVSPEFVSNFNKLYNSKELVLPIITFQRHVSSYASSETEPVVFVNSARHDVRRAYTVLTKPPSTTIQALSSATPQATIPSPHFLKGRMDTDQACVGFQSKFQDISFPSTQVIARTVGAEVIDQHHMLAHCLSNIPPTKTTPYMASMSPKHFAPVFEDEFIVVQDYRSSDDKNRINGLDMNSSGGSPLMLELKMNKADSSSTSTQVNTYLEVSSNIVIGPDGGVTIVSMK